MDALIRMVTRLLGPLKRRVYLMVGRAVIKLVSDAGGVQRLQLVALDGEVLADVERFQEYGFTSHPHPSAEAVLVAVGGTRDHSLVVGVEDRRYRFQPMERGEVAIHDDLGQRVHLTRTGIEIVTPMKVTVTAPDKVRFVTPMLECTGEVKDRCDTADGRTMSDMRTAFDSHVHPENDAGGPTDPPTEAM